MILGNGLLASALFSRYEKDETVVIFAAGVSNSRETRHSEYKREVDIYNNIDRSKHVVYFSTCSIHDSSVRDTLYIKHKLIMEESIRRDFKCHSIIRLPTLVGNTKNPFTLINFFKHKILSGKTIQAYEDCGRNLMDIDDVKVIVPYLLENTEDQVTMDVAYPNKQDVIEMLHIMFDVMGKQVEIEVVESPVGDCIIPNSEFMKLLDKGIPGLPPLSNYTRRVFEKYLMEET